MRTALCAALIAGAAHATTLVPLTDQDLARLAHRVAVVTVVSAEASLQDPTGSGRAGIWTTVRVRLDDVLKGPGAPGDEVTFRQRGGSVGGRTLAIPGLPRFEAGARHVLFLNENLDTPRHSPLVGFAQGCWTVDSENVARRDFCGACWLGQPAPAQPEEGEALAALVARFRQEVGR